MSTTATPDDKQRAIIDQMEFYLSTSNLSKDRYTRNLIKKNDQRWIPLHHFSKFNKMKELTTEVDAIVDALRMSEILELTEDGKQVRRKVAYKPLSQDEIQARTVYVENMPLDASHDDIKAVFGQFGKVEYVSLPKIQVRGGEEGEANKLGKGFAFVEFDSKDSADKALAATDIKFEITQGEDAATEVARLVEQFQAEGDELVSMLVAESFGKGIKVNSKEHWNTVKNAAMEFKAEAEEQQMTKEEQRTALCRRAGMHFVPGSLVRLTGLSDKEGGKVIRDKLAEKVPIMYVDKEHRSNSAVAYCFRPEAAKFLVSEAETFGFTMEALTEQEETDYLKHMITRKRGNGKGKNNNNNRKNKRKSFGNNNRNNDNNNSNSNDNQEEPNAGDGPDTKKAKTGEE